MITIPQDAFAAALLDPDIPQMSVGGATYPVAIIGRGWFAALDAVDALKGRVSWYTATMLAPGVVDLRSPGDRGLHVGGMPVSGDDISPVLASCRAAPDSTGRHSEGANEARLKAGKLALKVRDGMVRARLLDAVDGWAAIEESGTVLSRSDEDGILVVPHPDLELNGNVLLVVCPSTGRRYAIPVAAEWKTAKEARQHGVMRGLSPDVET